MSKYEDTRIVTFKEDYAHQMRNKKGEVINGPDGKPKMRVFYKKGSQHAIHFKLVKKLEGHGAKMDVKDIDLKKVRDQRKSKMAQRKKKQVELSYQ